MSRSSTLLAACLVVAAAPAVRADLPDEEARDKYSLRLRQMGLKPLPICATAPHKGVIGLNDNKVYGASLRVLFPEGFATVITETSTTGTTVTTIPIRPGWHDFPPLAPSDRHAYVNVGPTQIEADGVKLRKGEYVRWDGSRLVKGSLRPPDRERVEPRDTRRELAEELYSAAVARLETRETDAARSTLQLIIREYPETTYAERALEKLQRIGPSGPVKAPAPGAAEPLPERVFVKAVGQTDAEAAAHLLSLAHVLRDSKRPADARAVLRGLIDRYPQTKAAVRAAALLDTLPR